VLSHNCRGRDLGFSKLQNLFVYLILPKLQNVPTPRFTGHEYVCTYVRAWVRYGYTALSMETSWHVRNLLFFFTWLYFCGPLDLDPSIPALGGISPPPPPPPFHIAARACCMLICFLPERGISPHVRECINHLLPPVFHPIPLSFLALSLQCRTPVRSRFATSSPLR
jgi:hypothetical protein